jgi:hypothetical protein
VPIVLYDPVAYVLACAHAGWRGTVARVAASAVSAMESLGAHPADIIAGVGPAVAAARYQVSAEVAGAATATFGDQAPAVLEPAGPAQWRFDLWTANRLVLRAAGVPDAQIHTTNVPTGDQFFSHRAEQPCGRFAAIARLDRLDRKESR